MPPVKQILLVGCALASLAFMNGCASVTRGTKDTLVVETDPAGANVRLSTGQTGKAPTSFQLPRKKAFDVYIEKEGYESITVHVSSQVSGKGSVGMAGNVLIGGIIGIGVDAMTGASKDLKPNPVKVTLVPLKKADPIPATSAPQPAPAAPVETPAAPPVTTASAGDTSVTPAQPAASL